MDFVELLLEIILVIRHLDLKIAAMECCMQVKYSWQSKSVTYATA